jgi:hypothetical protein
LLHVHADLNGLGLGTMEPWTESISRSQACRGRFCSESIRCDCDCAKRSTGNGGTIILGSHSSFASRSARSRPHGLGAVPAQLFYDPSSASESVCDLGRPSKTIAAWGPARMCARVMYLEGATDRLFDAQASWGYRRQRQATKVSKSSSARVATVHGATRLRRADCTTANLRRSIMSHSKRRDRPVSRCVCIFQSLGQRQRQRRSAPPTFAAGRRRETQ